VKRSPTSPGSGRYGGGRLVWMTVGCASFVAACGLDLAGEEVVNGDASGSGKSRDADAAASIVEAGTFGLQDGETDAGTGIREPPDGSASSADAAGSCDFTGTWGSLITIAVSWAPEGLNLQTFLLAPGSGTIRQWIKGLRVQRGTSLEDTTFVCGIELPDFQGTQVVAGQTYGVTFPDSLFDGTFLPSFQVQATVTSSAPGATYSASASAALLGLTMANPTTDPWPTTVTTATDPDKDGTPGVTVDVAQGAVAAPGDAGSYSYIPVGIPAPFEPVVVADRLHVAIRQVTEVTGTVVDCDHVSGTVSIPQIAGQYAINSHVLGCELVDGGDCTDTQASFVDNTQPVFSPSGATAFASVRLPPGATCAAVRAMLR
jgi:hypothetical protein